MLTNARLDLAALILRLALAATFLVHGFIKIDQHSALREDLTLTEQRLIGAAELVCGALLLVGLMTRLAAAGIVVLQLGAIWFVTGDYAFDVTTIKKHVGIDFRMVGPEYNMVLIAMALCILLLGGGRFALDRWAWDYWRRGKTSMPIAETGQARAQVGA